MGAPIDPQQFIHGASVIDIGDLRVARGLTRRPFTACKHLNLVYDATERRVWCQDCESEVETFDAFLQMVSHHHYLDSKLEQIRRDAAHTITSRAAKRMDEAWRSHKMAPCCPHCNAAILPEDIVDGIATTNKEWEIRRRAAEEVKRKSD